MAYFTKNKLSESAFGRGIKVWATHVDFPTFIHKASCPENDIQEAWLWGHNESNSEVKLYICIYPMSGKKTYFCVPLPAGMHFAPTLLSPGLPIKNGTKIKAYTTSADKVTIYGYLNQVEQSTKLAELVGFGTNDDNESSHPYIGGLPHEILFDEDGKTVACGDRFNIAVRPNGTVFGWGAGNLVSELLKTGINEPWKNNVDTYQGNDYLIVSADGVPAHRTPYKNINVPNPGDNPNKVQKQDYYFNLPLVQTNTPTSVGLGRIGVSVDGVVFYNYDDSNGNVAPIAEAASLDSCRGHVDQNGVYHYHQWSPCLDPTFDSATGQHSPLLGYAFDGYPIFGPRQESGILAQSSYKLQTGADSSKITGYEYDSSSQIPGISLDVHNGHLDKMPDGTTGYHYHTTIDSNEDGVFPYVIGPSGYKGVPLSCNLPGQTACERAIAFPKDLTNVKEVQVGGNHALALKANNRLVAWGDNSYGQCDIPTTLENGISSFAVGENHSLAVQAGRIIAWGRNDRGQVDSIPSPKSVVSVTMTASGDDYLLVPTVNFTNGGAGSNGAAGLAVLAGTSLATLSLIDGGDGYTQPPSVIFEGGGGVGATAYSTLTSSTANPAFGYVSSLVLTNAGAGYTSAPTVSIVDETPQGVPKGEGATAVTSISLQQVSGVILSAGGDGYFNEPDVYFANHPDDNQGGGAEGVGLITGSESATAVPLQVNGEDISDVKKVSAGVSHSMALKTDHTYTAWGDNTYAQNSVPDLGAGFYKMLDIACGGYHTLAIIENIEMGRKYISAWGGSTPNDWGQTSVPNAVSDTLANEIGNREVKISAGKFHSLFLSPGGLVSGFGYNLHGQVDTDNVEDANSIMSGPLAYHSLITTRQVFSKANLSDSNYGEGILVDREIETYSVDVQRTHVHRSSDNPFGFEEVWVWAYNTSPSPIDLDLYLEPKETSSLFSIKVIDGGAGYDQIPSVEIGKQIPGHENEKGQGAVAYANFSLHTFQDITGYVSSIDILLAGSGYMDPPTIKITGGAEDLSELVAATAIAVVETGERMTFSIPPRSGLYPCLVGHYIPSLYNIRAAASVKSGIYIYGFTNREEKGVQGNTLLFDNPYQLGEIHTYASSPAGSDPSPDPGPDPGGSPAGGSPGGDPYGGEEGGGAPYVP